MRVFSVNSIFSILYNLLILALFAGILLASCSKEQSVKTPKSFTKAELENLNKYRPAEDVLPDVYHSFRKEIEEMKESTYKTTIDPTDRPVDEAVWLLEALTNANWGFNNDSIEELYIDTIQLIFNNESFTSDGIPIINGLDIVQSYTSLETSIIDNNNVGHLFWATRIDIIDFTTDQTSIEIINAGGPKSDDLGAIITPLPPGTNIEPFPSGHWNYAGTFNTYMAYAEADFWNRIRAKGHFELDEWLHCNI